MKFWSQICIHLWYNLEVKASYTINKSAISILKITHTCMHSCARKFDLSYTSCPSFINQCFNLSDSIDTESMRAWMSSLNFFILEECLEWARRLVWAAEIFEQYCSQIWCLILVSGSWWHVIFTRSSGEHAIWVYMNVQKYQQNQQRLQRGLLMHLLCSH